MISLEVDTKEFVEEVLTKPAPVVGASEFGLGMSRISSWRERAGCWCSKKLQAMGWDERHQEGEDDAADEKSEKSEK